jgi:hypothetical protein
MRIIPVALAFVLTGATAAFAVSDVELRTKIVGTWSDTAECAAGMLVFNADGTFVSRDTGSSEADALRGTYQIEDGKLNGKAEDHDMPEVTVSFDGETLVMAAAGDTDRLTRCAKP